MSGPLLIKPQAEWGRLHALTFQGLNTGGAASFEIRTGTVQAAIREIWMLNDGTSGSRQGIGRPAAMGVTPSGPVTFLPCDPDDQAPQTVVAKGWTTPPTSPVNFLRQWSPIVGLTKGDGIVLTFGPRELVIPANSSLVVWNLFLTGTAPSTSVTIQE